LLRAKNRPRHEWLRHFFFHGNALCHPSVLIRRRCYEEVGLYNPALAQVPDLEMWVRLLREHEIHLIEEPLIGFRIRDNEMNASAARPEVIVRDQWEWLKVLEQYLNLGDTLLAQVFPEIASRAGQAPVAWLVAKMALQRGSPAHVLFALDTMYNVVADGSDGARCRAFITATGRYDPFGMLRHRSENHTSSDALSTGAATASVAEEPAIKANR
jgi:ribosomal protein S16